MSDVVPKDSVVASWGDLAKLIEDTSRGGWIFRGESSCDKELKPKAGRFGSYSGSALKTAYDLEQERKALEQFQRQARPHVAHTPASSMEWLAIAQHHGMATRLLDWTESLLVAAFFATERAGTKGPALIYGVKGLKDVTAKDERAPFNVRAVRVYRPPHIAARIPAQRSVFTVHPDPTEVFSHKLLVRWTISQDACIPIKRMLDSCAINDSSLFPDLDGLSRYIGWRYKWGLL